MKKIIALIFIFSAACIFAQEKVESKKVKKPKTVKTASGLEYKITSKGNGKKPQVGDKVIVHYTGKLTNDTVFDSSYRLNQPFEFKLGAGQVIKGWDEAFQLLQIGDKATIKFGPELGYGDRQAGKIPPKSTLIFDVELIDIKEGVRQWVASSGGTRNAKKMDTIKTASGLKYILFQENKSGAPAANSKATVHYSGFFRDGKMFDSSVERGKPFTVEVGGGQVIKGWDEGLALLRKGEKAKLIIPHQLAYGEMGYGQIIPPKSDLIFDVEIIDVAPVPIPVPYEITGKELKKTASGLEYYEVKRAGSPVKAVPGTTVKVHYTGYFKDSTSATGLGKIFDSSIKRGDPIEFQLGQGMVIQGWEEGIALMNVGDQLRLVIPYYLAYGEQGRPPQIPEKAVLIFDVELIEVH